VVALPQALCDQLAEGGRLATVITRAGGMAGYGVLAMKVQGAVSDRPLFDAMTPLLPGFAPEPEFVF
jgi:protein-L-isoaspartate(D-aspartate) O-methyltransferase